MGTKVLADGREMRLRPLMEDKLKRMVEADSKPTFSHYSDQLSELRVSKHVVIVG